MKSRYANTNIKKKGQQEIVGFVLIVVVVMVAVMVFFAISIRDSGEEISDDLEISNLIDSVLHVTSECAIVYEPDYDDYEELLKSCYRGKRCKNLDIDSCEYLNESLNEILLKVIGSESNLAGYSVSFFAKGGEDLMGWNYGHCSTYSSGAQKSIVSTSDTLVLRFRVCSTV
jgi:hypothetical protein